MKKYFIYSVSALAIASSLASCSNEDEFGPAGAQRVELNVTANRGGDALSRTAFENVDGNLLCTWDEDDQLVAFNAAGTNLGVLTIKAETLNGAKTTATFSGNVTIADGETVRLYYVGNGATGLESLTSEGAIALGTQLGTIEDLAANDFLSSQAAVEFRGGKAVATVEMKREVAEGYFQLTMPEGVTLTAEDFVTISAESGILPVEATVNYSTATVTPATTTGEIKVNIAGEAANSFYVTMLPCNVAPKFVVVKGNKTYTATLTAHDWIAGQYVRKSNGDGTYSGVPVEMTVEKLPEGDGKIFGIAWAGVNSRSWIDCTTSDDDAYYFSYIPNVPLAEQGLEVKYTDDNMVSGTNNPYAYQFQWGRNFGFPASTGNLINTYVPNYLNLPLSWGNQYLKYGTYQSTMTENESIQNPDVLIYLSQNDWCSDKTFDEWPCYEFTYDDGTSELLSVAPHGYRLPTKADFETLLPTGNSGETFTATKSFNVDGETIRPVYAKSTSEGTTVVWAILNSSTNYMALYELVGNYTLDQLTADLFGENGKVIDYIDFPAHGCRNANTSAANLQYYQQEGWYWSGDAAESDKTRANMMRFSISGNSITIYVATTPKRCVLSVRCVKE